MNMLLKIYLKNKLRIKRYLKSIIAFILRINLCSSTLVFMLYGINVLYFLSGFLPVFNAVRLY
jgi:hypothetical protein